MLAAAPLRRSACLCAKATTPRPEHHAGGLKGGRPSTSESSRAANLAMT